MISTCAGKAQLGCFVDGFTLVMTTYVDHQHMLT